MLQPRFWRALLTSKINVAPLYAQDKSKIDTVRFVVRSLRIALLYHLIMYYRENEIIQRLAK